MYLCPFVPFLERYLCIFMILAIYFCAIFKFFNDFRDFDWFWLILTRFWSVTYVSLRFLQVFHFPNWFWSITFVCLWFWLYIFVDFHVFLRFSWFWAIFLHGFEAFLLYLCDFYVFFTFGPGFGAFLIYLCDFGEYFCVIFTSSDGLVFSVSPSGVAVRSSPAGLARQRIRRRWWRKNK